VFYIGLPWLVVSQKHGGALTVSEASPLCPPLFLPLHILKAGLLP
jgi:hypothetical protein